MAKPVNVSKSYGQYCPLALATELLGRRWTILVVSRLLDGCTTFSEIHRGVPKISPTLLSTRLSELEHAGIVARKKVKGRDRSVYDLTDAGKDLDEIVNRLAVWGQHWARDNELADLDLGFLAWSMSLRVDTVAMPPGRTVVEFEFSGAPTEFRRFWLLNHNGEIDMCLKHPGIETDLLVQSDLRRFVETWRGFRDLQTEIRTSRIRLIGPRDLKKAFPDWLLLSSLAPFERRNGGREQRMSAAKKSKSGRQIENRNSLV